MGLLLLLTLVLALTIIQGSIVTAHEDILHFF